MNEETMKIKSKRTGMIVDDVRKDDLSYYRVDASAKSPTGKVCRRFTFAEFDVMEDDS